MGWSQPLGLLKNNNILNKNAPGYNSSEALLTTEAAQALINVQEYLSTRGFSLVIYDAYHPYKTYKTFEEWSSAPEHPAIKENAAIHCHCTYLAL